MLWVSWRSGMLQNRNGCRVLHVHTIQSEHMSAESVIPCLKATLQAGSVGNDGLNGAYKQQMLKIQMYVHYWHSIGICDVNNFATRQRVDEVHSSRLSKWTSRIRILSCGITTCRMWQASSTGEEEFGGGGGGGAGGARGLWLSCVMIPPELRTEYRHDT